MHCIPKPAPAGATLAAPAPRRRPRIARRFVPRHSLAITLDWDLTSSEKNCLAYLLSKPRQGAVISGVSAGEIAAAFDRDVRTARRWLEGLAAQTYLVTRPGQVRGSLVVLLAPKATRWCQLREGDYLRNEKREKPAKPRPCARPRTFLPASKETEEKKEEATGAPVPRLLKWLGELASRHHGTAAGRHYAARYVELLARLRALEQSEAGGSASAHISTAGGGNVRAGRA